MMNYICITSIICFMVNMLLLQAGSSPQEKRTLIPKPRYIENPLPHQCGAAINPDTKRYDNIYQALECMQLGYKFIYWGYTSELFLPQVRSSIEKMSLKQMTFKDHFILYTKEGKHNALLLQQYQKEKSSHHINHYLLGFLLGYTESDMVYFYKRCAIFEPLRSVLKDRIRINYADMTPEEQTQFDTLVSNHPTWKSTYEQDKIQADQWLADHECDR